MKYRPEIDGLRAVAVLPVIFFHAGFAAFSGGFVGVDVFFVISGYLITTIIVDELAQGRFSIVNFYERRARRILPALFLVLAATVPFAWAWLVPLELKSFAQSLVAVVLFSSNVLFWQTSDYFATAAELKPLLHTWSLAVEEQYYVFFPPLLMVLWRFGRRRILAVLGLAALVSLGLAQWLSTAAPAAAFYLLPTRGWELIIGAAVAFRHTSGARSMPTGPRAEFGAVAGIGMIGWAVFAFDKSLPFPSVYALLPTVGTALIIEYASARTLVGRLLATRPCVGIGLISYSAYLWHQPLFALSRLRDPDGPSPAMLLGLAVLALMLAWVSWRYVEAPFRSRQRVSRAQIFTFGAVGSVLIGSAGLVGHLAGGFEDLKTTPAMRAVLATASASPRRKDCHFGTPDYPKAAAACEYLDGQLRWAVFGDSHGVELAYALAEALRERGEKLKHFTFSGCMPTFGRAVAAREQTCAEWTEQAVAYIVDNPAIENVVVSYDLSLHLHGAIAGHYPNLPDEVDAEERLARWVSYKRLVEHLVAHGKHVIVARQAPELPQPPAFLAMRAAAPERSVEGVTSAWWHRREAFVNERMGELPAGVTVVDPESLFCTGARCYAARDGVAYYFDDNHLSVAGAQRVAQAILRSMAR